MMTATQVDPSPVAANYRDLVSDVTFERLVGRIATDEGIERPLAEEIMEAAICFLALYGQNPDESFSPSPLVDIGWHTFILYTREYASFCDKVAGRFIHHEPNDMPDAPQAPGGLQRAIDVMSANGVPYNELLWTGSLTPKKAEIVLGGALRADGDCITKRCNPTNCTCS